nr:hypothetical protein [uncultured Roseateles sp.]
MSVWAQHGEFTLRWQGDVLMASYSGIWNEEAARQLHNKATQLWQMREGRPWGLLSDGSRWEGGTPEALALWWGFFEDGVRHGLRAATDILPTSFHGLMVRALKERAERLARYQRSDSVEDGLRWLSAQGFNSD